MTWTCWDIWQRGGCRRPVRNSSRTRDTDRWFFFPVRAPFFCWESWRVKHRSMWRCTRLCTNSRMNLATVHPTIVWCCGCFVRLTEDVTDTQQRDDGGWVVDHGVLYLSREFRCVSSSWLLSFVCYILTKLVVELWLRSSGVNKVCLQQLSPWERIRFQSTRFHKCLIDTLISHIFRSSGRWWESLTGNVETCCTETTGYPTVRYSRSGSSTSFPKSIFTIKKNIFSVDHLTSEITHSHWPLTVTT